MGSPENADRRLSPGRERAEEVWRARREIEWSFATGASARSEGVWIEGLRSTGTMLRDRFIGEASQHVRPRRHRVVNSVLRRQFVQKGTGESVLICFR
jgi:hypothetical protein